MPSVIKGDSNVNLDFSTGGRITGDFSNGTIANRVMFQTSTANSATSVSAIPSGTNTQSDFFAFNAADPNNASLLLMRAGAAETTLRSGITGTGSYLPMTFYTGGSERMRVDTSGNVGIGTGSPLAGTKLSINGSMSLIPYYSTYLVNSYYDGAWKYAGNGVAWGIGNNFGGTTNGTTIAVATSNSGGSGASLTWNPAFNIDTSGNVGIGTGSPSFKLDVTGTLRSTGEARFDNAINLKTATLNQVYFDDAVAFTKNGTGERMRIDSSGNVGIGASSTNRLSLTYDGGTGAATIGPNSTGGSTYLTLGTSNAGTYAERARIDSSGNLLVGTTSNNGRLTVDATALGGSNQGVWAKNSGGSGATFIAWNAVTTGNPVFVDFYTETSAAQRGTISYNRGAGLTAYNTTSDYRAKDIHGPVLNALETVAQLKPYMGTMKGATVERPMFVAHEAQQVTAYAVVGDKDAVNDKGEPVYQQMDHSTLVPLLTAAIQEQQAIITALTARVTALEGQP